MVIVADVLNPVTAENEVIPPPCNIIKPAICSPKVDVGRDLLKTSVTLKYIGSFWYYGKFKLQWPLTLGNV